MTISDDKLIEMWCGQLVPKPEKIPLHRLKNEIELRSINAILASDSLPTGNSFEGRPSYADGSSVPVLTDGEFVWLLPGLIIESLMASEPLMAQAVVGRVLNSLEVCFQPLLNSGSWDRNAIADWFMLQLGRCVSLGWPEERRLPKLQRLEQALDSFRSGI